jgi:hypothetical protein
MANGTSTDSLDTPAEDTPADKDAAASVKSRRAGKRPQATLDNGIDDEPEAEIRSHPLELAAHRPSPAHTLTGSWIAGHITSTDYTVARDHAYLTWYPEGCQQTSTRLLWTRGQHVLREYYDRFGGDNAPSEPHLAEAVNEPGGGLFAEGRGMASVGIES